MKIVSVFALSGLILAGCATTRPEMPDDKYAGFARAWNATYSCMQSGRLDAATAARGRTYVNSAINTYSYSRDRMVEEIKQGAVNNTFTEQECLSFAMDIHARKQQIEQQNAQTEQQNQAIQAMINNNKPTQTYCNKIGTQVFCNSF